MEDFYCRALRGPDFHVPGRAGPKKIFSRAGLEISGPLAEFRAGPRLQLTKNKQKKTVPTSEKALVIPLKQFSFKAIFPDWASIKVFHFSRPWKFFPVLPFAKLVWINILTVANWSLAYCVSDDVSGRESQRTFCPHDFEINGNGMLRYGKWNASFSGVCTQNFCIN